MNKPIHGRWVTIYSRTNGWAPMWLSHRLVSMCTSFMSSLINVRYTTRIAVSLTTSRGLQPSAILACLLIAFFQIQALYCRVSILAVLTFFWLTLFQAGTCLQLL